MLFYQLLTVRFVAQVQRNDMDPRLAAGLLLDFLDDRLQLVVLLLEAVQSQICALQCYINVSVTRLTQGTGSTVQHTEQQCHAPPDAAVCPRD